MMPSLSATTRSARRPFLSSSLGTAYWKVPRSIAKRRISVATLSRQHRPYPSSNWNDESCSFRFFSTSTATKDTNNKFSIAVVGSGPSGCYTAKYLLSAFDKLQHAEQDSKDDSTVSCQIDMLERLPTPYGLVRYGVAPDHPEVKNVEHDFAQLFQDDNNKERLQFWGNVPVGNDTDGVTVQELRQLYDVVVLAYGCESDRKLGVPGEDSVRGILSAREFVAWYNGHPYFDHIGQEVANALDSDNNNNGSSNNKQVVIIGQGNVALDCARILAKGGKGLLATDIASRALPVIGDDGVLNVTVVGRRGHVQGAFTIKELRELTRLEEEGHGAKFIVRNDELDMGETPATKEELEQKGGRPKVRINKLLRDAATDVADTTTTDAKQVRIRFLLSPQEFLPSDADPSTVGAVVCERTQLEGQANQQRAVGTGQTETLPADLVLVSIGYKGTALPGVESWFEEQRGVVQHHGGKVDGANHEESLGGLYVSGWLKRGPSGIIGTNIMDAKDTVVSIMRDLDKETKSRSVTKPFARQQLTRLLLQDRKIPVVRWSDYERLNAEETSSEHKRRDEQPREKIVRISEMLQAAGVSSSS